MAPADIFLSAIPEMLAGLAGREDMLSDALATVRGDYDYVIVDCPPNVGLLTFNALKACSEAIVPMDPSFFSLHGIAKLLETFDLLAQKSDHHIEARVLVTLYPGRAPFVKAVVDELHRHLDGRYFETIIRYSIKLAEAASHGVPIAQYCRHCVGFDDYQALVANHRAALRAESEHFGWTFTVHRTDRGPTELLFAIHGQLGSGAHTLLRSRQPARGALQTGQLAGVLWAAQAHRGRQRGPRPGGHGCLGLASIATSAPGSGRVRVDDKPATNDQGPTAADSDQALDLLLR